MPYLAYFGVALPSNGGLKVIWIKLDLGWVERLQLLARGEWPMDDLDLSATDDLSLCMHVSYNEWVVMHVSKSHVLVAWCILGGWCNSSCMPFEWYLCGCSMTKLVCKSSWELMQHSRF